MVAFLQRLSFNFQRDRYTKTPSHEWDDFFNGMSSDMQEQMLENDQKLPWSSQLEA